MSCRLIVIMLVIPLLLIYYHHRVKQFVQLFGLWPNTCKNNHIPIRPSCTLPNNMMLNIVNIMPTKLQCVNTVIVTMLVVIAATYQVKFRDQVRSVPVFPHLSHDFGTCYVIMRDRNGGQNCSRQFSYQTMCRAHNKSGNLISLWPRVLLVCACTAKFNFTPQLKPQIETL